MQSLLYAARRSKSSVDGLIDQNARVKSLIENKYLGKISQWEMSYVCDQLSGSQTTRNSTRVRYEEFCTRRSGSVTPQSKQSRTFWLTNVRLQKKKHRRPTSPLKNSILQAALQVSSKQKRKVFFASNRPAKMILKDQKQQEDKIIDYYKTKYQSAEIPHSNTHSYFSQKRKNLPKLELPKPLDNSRIDPW